MYNIPNKLLPCPFCGLELDINDCDTLYPSGYGWKDENGLRTYVSLRDTPSENWCYHIVCQVSYLPRGYSETPSDGACVS